VPREPLTPPRYEDLPDLCSPEDARAFLQVSRNTFYDLVKSGELPAIRFGKLIRVRKEMLLSGSGKQHG
jgi:excisionase family DNA binding protein